jgi:dTDP-4-amino-4,6-dideoxygalactose transaminase
MLNSGLSPWPSFTDEEADAVRGVLLSNKVNYWTGQECRALEREFADWVGTNHAISLANGTVALDVALKALGVGAGDEVVVTPRTFLASASCVAMAGCVPVFADVDVASQNITPESVEAALSPRTRAVICVHLAGWPCEIDPILELARKHGLAVIEDCAQAHGARYRGRSVGSLGDVGAWSFCQDKIMTTGGEGGMVTTNDPDLWSRMWSYKDHGKSWEAVYEREHPPGFRWLHESFGTNWRMIEMQAVIGRIQLRRMAEWTRARTRNASRLAAACQEFHALRVPMPPDHVEHAYYKFYVFVRPDQLANGWNRDRIIEAIQGKGVPCMQGSCSEVYLEKAFEETGFRPKYRLPVAKELGETSLMFLVHPTLTESEISMTCDAIRAVMKEASA